MNIFKIIPTLLLIVLCDTTIAASIITSYPDGIAKVGKQRKKLKLHRINETYKTATGLYFGGYLRNKAKQNTYAIGYISNDLQEEKYWNLKEPFTEFFTYKNELYILGHTGRIFHQVNDQWKEGQWRFPEYSHIAYSDKFIIACHPHSLAKEGAPTRNGCVAPEKKWEIVIDWAFVPPTMCNNVLTIWEYTHAPNAWTLPNDLVQFAPETGKEIARKHGVKQVKDICSIKFN